MLFEILDIAEGLFLLDPIRTFPQRGASLVAKLIASPAHRLELAGGRRVESAARASPEAPLLTLPLRNGKREMGTLVLALPEGRAQLDEDELRLVRWGGRLLARGLDYAERMGPRSRPRTEAAFRRRLARAPLTERERELVSLLVAGGSTKEIASGMGLTPKSVSTYLKRIFVKLRVHSRVELVARMAGTSLPAPAPPPNQDPSRSDEAPPSVDPSNDSGDVFA